MKQLTVHRLTTFPRSGTGGCPVAVVVEPEPLTDSARHALANQLGMLTAFIPLETPDPMPAVFFDKAGRQSEGEQALLGVFRALARTQRTIARRVRIDTDRGVVPVQEEVFRTPDLAQVWVEVPVPMLIPVTDPLLELHTGLQISGPTGAWRAGDTLLIHGASLAAVRGAQLDPHVLRTVLPEGLTGLLLFSMETTSPFSDAHVRHVITRGAGQEVPASITPNAALGVWIRAHGKTQPFLSLEQGFDAGSPSRVSVWIEAEDAAITRISVGGQVLELERIAQPWPLEQP